MKTLFEDYIKGSEFIVKESTPETIFTPENFSEEQILMKDSVKEFVDREIIAERKRFENKDYEYTKEVMQKAGELGFLVLVSQRNTVEWVCLSLLQCLFVNIFLELMVHFQQHLGLTQESVQCQ